MSDARDVPVFLRDINDVEPQFLGRFPIDQLDTLRNWIEHESCYTGDGNRSSTLTQFICYKTGARTGSGGYCGYEIILDGDYQ